MTPSDQRDYYHLEEINHKLSDVHNSINCEGVGIVPIMFNVISPNVPNKYLLNI